MRAPGRAALTPCLAAALVPLPASADLLCHFDTECLEGEPCAESGFSITIETVLAPGALIAEGGFPLGDEAVTDAGTEEVRWAGSGAALAAYWSSEAGFHMLSFDADGAARYSAHLPGAELSVLYVGNCGHTE